MITLEKIRWWVKQMTLDKNLATKATKKHHKHIVNPTFKSINHAGMPPAEYRRSHSKMVNGKIVKARKKKK